MLEKRVASLFIVSKLKKTSGMWVQVSSLPNPSLPTAVRKSFSLVVGLAACRLPGPQPANRRAVAGGEKTCELRKYNVISAPLDGSPPVDQGKVTVLRRARVRPSSLKVV